MINLEELPFSKPNSFQNILDYQNIHDWTKPAYIEQNHIVQAKPDWVTKSVPTCGTRF